MTNPNPGVVFAEREAESYRESRLNNHRVGVPEGDEVLVTRRRSRTTRRRSGTSNNLGFLSERQTRRRGPRRRVRRSKSNRRVRAGIVAATPRRRSTEHRHPGAVRVRVGVQIGVGVCLRDDVGETRATSETGGRPRGIARGVARHVDDVRRQRGGGVAFGTLRSRRRRRGSRAGRFQKAKMRLARGRVEVEYGGAPRVFRSRRSYLERRVAAPPAAARRQPTVSLPGGGGDGSEAFVATSRLLRAIVVVQSILQTKRGGVGGVLLLRRRRAKHQRIRRLVPRARRRGHVHPTRSVFVRRHAHANAHRRGGRERLSSLRVGA